MRAVKGASGGETGQDMNTRHNACVVVAVGALRGGALPSCSESSAVEPGEGQMGNVGLESEIDQRRGSMAVGLARRPTVGITS